MADVFISYAKKDGKEFAEHTWNVLSQTGFTPFFDKRNIPIGVEWMKKIDEEIQNSSKFVLILTEGVHDSDHVKYEYSKATILRNAGQTTILPFKLDTLPDAKIPEDMRKLQHGTFETKEGLARKVLIQVYPEETLSGKPIERDILKVKIERIFLNRRSDPKDPQTYEELSKQLEEQITNTTIGEVLMLGNSFRDFFGEDTHERKVRYKNVIENALKNNVQFKVLLLDPTSEAAKERAKIEGGPQFENDDRYKDSVLFKDIERVTDWLKRLDSPLVEVRYSTLTPAAFIIRSDRYTFIEQYHLGNLKRIETKIRKEDRKSLCLGGYVPFFMTKNTSDFAKLMKSHFDNIWEMMRDRPLEKVAEEITEFEKDSENYRRKQLIELINKKTEDLVKLTK